jgi:hypothetical protein
MKISQPFLTNWEQKWKPLTFPVASKLRLFSQALYLARPCDMMRHAHELLPMRSGYATAQRCVTLLCAEGLR